MRVERICGLCDRMVCSSCSRPVNLSTACHQCIAPDFTGRRTQQSFNQGYSELGRVYRQLLRDKQQKEAQMSQQISPRTIAVTAEKARRACRTCLRPVANHSADDTERCYEMECHFEAEIEVRTGIRS